MINILGVLLTLLFSVFFFLGDRDSFHSLYIPSTILVLAFTILTFWSNRERVYRDYWLRPTYICILGLMIVGFQLFIDNELGLSSLKDSIAFWSISYADKAFFSVAVFIVCFVLGVYNCNIKINSSKITINSTTHDADSSFVWLIILIATFVWFVSTIDITFFLSGAVYHGSGAADYAYSISDTIEGMFQKFFYITLASYIVKFKKNNEVVNSVIKYIKLLPIPFLIVVSFYLILRLLSGDRGPVIYFSLALLYSYLYISNYKLKLVTVMTFIVIGALFISFLSVFRSRDENMGIVEKIIESRIRFQEINNERQSIFSATRELGESLDTHFVAVRDIEENKTDYSLGRFALFSIPTAIPGLKRQYLYDMGLTPGQINSSSYVTISVSGKHYTKGMGSSVFAEAYLEFGLLGMILFGLLCGNIFKRIDTVFVSKYVCSVPLLAVIFRTSAQAIYLSRSSFAIEFSAVLHMLAFYYIINCGLKLIRK